MPVTERGHHGFGPRHDAVPPTGTTFKAGRFGRMVPELARPLDVPDAALVELGLAMVDGPGGKPSGNNANISAGFTYLAQFIDHDITLDTTGLNESLQDPNAVENFRTPRLDLDSVYGLGPRVQPSLYQRDSPGRAKLLIGTTSAGVFPVNAGLAHDLPRNSEGFAIIGDERNDENLLVAQTHLAFLRFHNAIVDKLHGTVPDSQLFSAARRAVVELYQSMVVRDFLTKLCDVNDINAALQQRRFFRFETFGAFGQPYMPLEFSVAAYRLGHSQVRNVWKARRASDVSERLDHRLAALSRFRHHRWRRRFCPQPDAQYRSVSRHGTAPARRRDRRRWKPGGDEPAPRRQDEAAVGAGPRPLHPDSFVSRNPSWRIGDQVPNLVLPGAGAMFRFSDLVASAAGGTSKVQLSPVDDPANIPP
jgi:hypothetical protein